MKRFSLLLCIASPLVLVGGVLGAAKLYETAQNNLSGVFIMGGVVLEALIAVCFTLLGVAAALDGRSAAMRVLLLVFGCLFFLFPLVVFLPFLSEAWFGAALRGAYIALGTTRCITATAFYFTLFAATLFLEKRSKSK